MRENLANPSPMETMPFYGFQPSSNYVCNGQKSIVTSVSSNVYYGYQPLRVERSSIEGMSTENGSKSFVEMDTSQGESHPINRKRTRVIAPSSQEVCKKRRQNEPPSTQPRPVYHSPRCSPTKMHLEEALLRETHGCSYYHWVSSNI